MTIELSVNGKDTKTEEDPDMPLLWFLRDSLGLKGTKFGCGISLCGACTVHVDGEPVRSCVLPLAAAAVLLIADLWAISKELAPSWYSRLRIPLTLVVVAALGVAAWRIG